jgi:EmrB/QacA subfamily drug resistance transporter
VSLPSFSSSRHRSGFASRWWILTFIAGAQLMIVLDTTIMLIALPQAQRALGFSTAGRQWVITAYTLGFGGLLLLGGRLGDRLGTRRALLLGVVGFALASALGGAAPDLGVLIAARAVQGSFAALLAPAVLAVLMTTFTDEGERGTAFGIWAAIATGGAALGFILGGALTQYFGWRWCLYVNLPISVVVALGVAGTVRSRRDAVHLGLDLPGSLLGSGGVAALVFGLGNAASSSWGSSEVVIPLIVAVTALAAFVSVEARSKNPLLPLRILANRNRGGSFLSITLAMFGYYGAFLFLTYILQGVLRLSPLDAGLGFLPLAIINGLTSTRVASRLLARVRVRAIVVPGLVFGAGGAVVLSRLTATSSYLALVLPAELLLGVGLGLSVMPLFATATRAAEPADAGATGAAANTAQQLGASIGTAVFNTIAAGTTASYLASHRGRSIVEAAVNGYGVGSKGVALALVVAAIVAGAFLSSRPAPRPVPQQTSEDAETEARELALDLTYEPEAL